MRRFLLASAFGAVGALVVVSAVLAGQPVTQTLTPPPPPFETCKAVGNGTICEGSIADSYGPVDTGLTCGTGPSASHILDAADTNEVAKRTYDANGDLVRRVRHDRASGHVSNSITGASVPYLQSQEWTDELAVPGDFASSTLTFTGQMILHRSGGPVLIGAGRTVLAPDGTVEFQAGPSGFLDLIFGAPAAVDPICAALAGS